MSTYMIQAASMPIIYLAIVGFEWLLLPSRFAVVKEQISINVVILTFASVGMTAAFWISDNVSICWK